MAEHDVANVEVAGSKPVYRSHGPHAKDSKQPPAKRSNPVEVRSGPPSNTEGEVAEWPNAAGC